MDVLRYRNKFNAELEGSTRREAGLVKHIYPYSLGQGRFSRVPCKRESDSSTVMLCAKAYGLVISGLSFTSWRRASASCSNKGLVEADAVKSESQPTSKVGSLDRLRTIMRSYIRLEVCRKAEHTPVPGAQREVEYVADKDTWLARFGRFQEYAEGARYKIEVSTDAAKRAFKDAWRSCDNLVSRAVKKHGQCDKCAKSAAKLHNLKNKNDPLSLAEAFKEKRDKDAHNKAMGVERSVLDDAGAFT